MANNPVSFIIASEVDAWDPETRVLHLGNIRLEIAPGVDVESLVPRQSVTVTAYGSKHIASPWMVTEIQVHRPAF